MAVLLSMGCSPGSKSGDKPAGASPDTAKTEATQAAKYHPLAKYLELAAFRLREASTGKLQVQFVVVNHSEAVLPELTMKVNLKAGPVGTSQKPLGTIAVKVPSLGPQEIKDVSSTLTTQLRVYELPDWQFLHADFEITSPPASQ